MCTIQLRHRPPPVVGQWIPILRASWTMRGHGEARPAVPSAVLRLLCYRSSVAGGRNFFRMDGYLSKASGGRIES